MENLNNISDPIFLFQEQARKRFNLEYNPKTCINKNTSEIDYNALQKAIDESDNIHIPAEKHAPIYLSKGRWSRMVKFEIPSTKGRPELVKFLKKNGII